MSSEAEAFNIPNPLQHKGKGRPVVQYFYFLIIPHNKRYLSVVENNSTNKDRDIQEETSDAMRKEIRDNAQSVNHGTMIREIVLKRAKR